MKKIKCGVGCLIAIISVHYSCAQQTLYPLSADSARLYVEYAVYGGFVNDSIFSSLGKGSLFLGRRGSVYVYQRKTADEFLKGMAASIPNEDSRKIVIEGMKKSRDLDRELSEVFAHYYDSTDYYVLKSLNDNYVWLSDTPHLTFEIRPEFREINGFKCQLAIGRNLKGDSSYIWFTESVPISAGPMYFYGLPGLIVSYYTPRSKILYKAVKFSNTEIPANIASKWLNGGRVVDKASYQNMLNKDARKVDRMLQMNRN